MPWRKRLQKRAAAGPLPVRTPVPPQVCNGSALPNFPEGGLVKMCTCTRPCLSQSGASCWYTFSVAVAALCRAAHATRAAGGPYMEITIRVFQGSPPPPVLGDRTWKLKSKCFRAAPHPLSRKVGEPRGAAGPTATLQVGGRGGSTAAFNLARFDINFHLPSRHGVLLAPRGESRSGRLSRPPPLGRL